MIEPAEAVEGSGRRDETSGVLNSNVLFEVLRRVDPVTLAIAACVSWEFRTVSEDEFLWENLCNDRWPSTKSSEAKLLVSSVGGFRKLYKQCYPFIVNRTQPPFREDLEEHKEHEDVSVSHDHSASNLVSIVDVVYGEQSVFSKILEGIPRADDCAGWLSNCPFRLDLLRQPDKFGCAGESVVIVERDILSATSKQQVQKGGRKDGMKIWKMLYEKMRVSWILIDRKSKQATNLASWGPVGIRDWLGDQDYLLRFGSVLPGSCNGIPVQCNITMVCTMNFGEMGAGEVAKTTVTLTELSLQLEDFGGVIVTVKNTSAILNRAFSCCKSRKHTDVLESYPKYVRQCNEWKDKEYRADGRLNAAAALTSAICSCFFIVWFFGY